MKACYLNESSHVMGTPNFILGLAMRVVEVLKTYWTETYDGEDESGSGTAAFIDTFEREFSEDAELDIFVYDLGISDEFEGIEFNLWFYLNNGVDEVKVNGTNVFIPFGSRFIFNIISSIVKDSAFPRESIGKLCSSIEKGVNACGNYSDDLKSIKLVPDKRNVSMVMNGDVNTSAISDIICFSRDCEKGIDDSEFVEDLRLVYETCIYNSSSSHNIDEMLPTIVDNMKKCYSDPSLVSTIADELKYYCVYSAGDSAYNGTVNSNSLVYPAKVIRNVLFGYMFIDFIKAMKIILERTIECKIEIPQDSLIGLLNLMGRCYVYISKSGVCSGESITMNDYCEDVFEMKVFEIVDGVPTKNEIVLSHDFKLTYFTMLQCDGFQRSMFKAAKEYFLENADAEKCKGLKTNFTIYAETCSNLNGRFIADKHVIDLMITHLMSLIDMFLNNVLRGNKYASLVYKNYKRMCDSALAASYENGYGLSSQKHYKDIINYN